jgi:hypothetical protein
MYLLQIFLHFVFPEVGSLVEIKEEHEENNGMNE